MRSSGFQPYNFYPRPPRGGRQTTFLGVAPEDYISIHALREEGDASQSDHQISQNISIHALREEGDFLRQLMRCQFPYFYPRPPRGGRHNLDLKAAEGKTISIHALREEGDP